MNAAYAARTAGQGLFPAIHMLTPGSRKKIKKYKK